MSLTIDRRRNNGPSSTYTPRLPPSSRATQTSTDNADERSPAKVYLKTGLVARCHGSAYLETRWGDVGGLKVVCSVHGPRPVGGVRGGASSGTHAGGGGAGGYSWTAQLVVDVRYAPFARVGARSGYLRTRHERALAAAVADALTPNILLHKFPKSEIAVHLAILQQPVPLTETGAVAVEAITLAGAINTAMAAVADAGVECRDVVAAAAVRVVGDGVGGRKVLVDCLGGGDGEGDEVTVTVGCMAQRREVTLLHLTGLAHAKEEINIAMETATDQATRIAGVIRRALLEEYSEELQQDTNMTGTE
ncbi:3'-5'-exoribonuclease [Savitreella phatthalungensis]